MTELSAPCPSCGATLDLPRRDILDGSHPEAGDVVICWWCGFLSEAYGDSLSLRPLPADRAEYGDPQVQKIQEDIRARRRLRRVV